MKGRGKLAVATYLVLVFMGCVGLNLRSGEAEGGAPPILSSHLTAADRQVFYHLEEGSEIFPLDWLLALNQAGTQRPFLENAERFGLNEVLRAAMTRSRLYVFEPNWVRYIDNSRRFGYKFEVRIAPRP